MEIVGNFRKISPLIPSAHEKWRGKLKYIYFSNISNRITKIYIGAGASTE